MLAVSIDDLPTFPDPTESFFDYDGAYVPSPDEIRRECERIRAGWPPELEIARRQWAADRELVAPVVPTSPGRK